MTAIAVLDRLAKNHETPQRHLVSTKPISEQVPP